MTARAKIEELTNGWYGLAAFGAVVSVLQNGIGIFSLFFTIMALCFSLFVTFFLGRRLLARSSLTRMVLLVLSAVLGVLGSLGVVKLIWAFFGSFSFGLLLTAAVAAATVLMHFRSFRTLTDSSVKSYFN